MFRNLELNMAINPVYGKTAGWVFGIAVFAAGFINSFWGNDPYFGLFLILISFIYFPPINAFVEKLFGFSIPLIIKIILGFFVIVATLGVGELFDKIDLMKKDF